MEFDAIFAHAINTTAQAPFVRPLAEFCAGPLIWIMLAWYIYAFVVLKKGWVREFLTVGLGVALVYITNITISLAWFRPRPFVVGVTKALIYISIASKSFPSDHASIAFFFAFLLTIHRPQWKWPAYGAAIAVSLGRVVVGVHYPVDVLAGAVIGTAFGYLAFRLEKMFGPLPNRVLQTNNHQPRSLA